MKWKDVFSPIRFRRNPARLRLAVKGRVQGVGFRPSVYRLAKRAGVSGYIRNTRHGVIVEIEGSHDAIDRFGESLLSDHPPLARIDSIEALEIEPIGSRDFTIEVSEEPGAAETLFPVDTAVCEDCLREMRDPADKALFWTYPAADGTSYAEVEFAKVPTIIVYDDEDEWQNANVGVKEDYVEPLMNYLLYRAFGKDTDIPGNMDKSKAYWALFAQSMGLPVSEGGA